MLNKSLSWVPAVPSKAAVADFRIFTGHERLRFYLNITGIANSSDCTLWDYGQPMTSEHLDVYPALISHFFSRKILESTCSIEGAIVMRGICKEQLSNSKTVPPARTQADEVPYRSQRTRLNSLLN
ncbi:hypothetical protein TNCV_4916821 [Trichonephila clavipes]|nr:hypothetical protein TNCV_4916821 [Trichonephila clavipes]